MQRHLIALVTGLLLLLCGGTASALANPAIEAAGQLVANAQHAASAATSTQQSPTNQSIDVRIFSPGDSGSVTQSNSSTATSTAANANAATQSATQDQGGGGIQAVGQAASNQQHADADAASTQVHPTNTRISVRIGSPGNDGDVSQSNSSTATGTALNANRTDQSTAQDAGGGCCRDGGGTQAVGQQAANRQDADAEAASTQVRPTNRAISVRIGSPGDDGDVDQSNRSTATANAANANRTTQDATQARGDGRCGCASPGVQAAGQFASSWQHADADATSQQLEPSNESSGLRIGSGGGGGSLGQSNESNATARALNLNWLSQVLRQIE